MSHSRLRLLSALLLAALAWPAAAQDMPPMPEPAPMEGVVTFPVPGPPPPPGPAVSVFAPGQVLTTAQLNAALANPTVLGGSINNAPIGVTIPSSGRFTTLRADGSFEQPTGVAIFGGAGNFQVGSGGLKRALFTSHFAPTALI